MLDEARNDGPQPGPAERAAEEMGRADAGRQGRRRGRDGGTALRPRGHRIQITMVPALNVPLGAPGIYVLPDVPIARLTGVRMDVCAFLGVAPRGPAREPVLDIMSRNCKAGPPCCFANCAAPCRRGGKLRRIPAALWRLRGAGASAVCRRVVFRAGRPAAYIGRIVPADLARAGGV